MSKALHLCFIAHTPLTSLFLHFIDPSLILSAQYPAYCAAGRDVVSRAGAAGRRGAVLLVIRLREGVAPSYGPQKVVASTPAYGSGKGAGQWVCPAGCGRVNWKRRQQCTCGQMRCTATEGKGRQHAERRVQWWHPEP